MKKAEELHSGGTDWTERRARSRSIARREGSSRTHWRRMFVLLILIDMIWKPGATSVLPLSGRTSWNVAAS